MSGGGFAWVYAFMRAGTGRVWGEVGVGSMGGIVRCEGGRGSCGAFRNTKTN